MLAIIDKMRFMAIKNIWLCRFYTIYNTSNEAFQHLQGIKKSVIPIQVSIEKRTLYIKIWNSFEWILLSELPSNWSIPHEWSMHYAEDYCYAILLPTMHVPADFNMITSPNLNVCLIELTIGLTTEFKWSFKNNPKRAHNRNAIHLLQLVHLNQFK